MVYIKNTVLPIMLEAMSNTQPATIWSDIFTFTSRKNCTYNGNNSYLYNVVLFVNYKNLINQVLCLYLIFNHSRKEIASMALRNLLQVFGYPCHPLA